MKRKMAYIGISFAAAMFFASFLSAKLNIITAASAVLLSVAASFIFKKCRKYILVISLSAASAFALMAAYDGFWVQRILSYSGKEVEIVGEVTDFKYLTSDMMKITVDGKINGNAKTKVSFITSAEDIDYYDQVAIKAEVSKIENNVNYSSKDYYNSLGIYLEGGDVSQINITRKGFSTKRYILRYRDYLFDEITSYLPGDTGGFLGAMLCGDKSELDSATKLSLYRTGLGHIFALSGTHVVIVTGVLSTILSLFFKNRKALSIMMLLMIAVFTVFAGASPSVVRAALMAGLLHSSGLFNRQTDSLNSLGLAAFLILLFSPAAVRSVSFILSFAGAYSVSVLSPYILKRFSKTRYKILAAFVIPNVVISAVTIPVSLFVFNEVSVISPVANIIMLPLCDAALTLTALTAVVGGWAVITHPILILCSYLVKSVLVGAEFLSKLPFAYLSTDSLWFDFASAALCTVIIIILIKSPSLKKAFVSSAACIAAVCAFSVFGKTLFKSESVYLIAKDSACAVIITEDSYAAVIDIAGKSTLSPAIEKVIEDKSVSSADVFLCNRPDHKKAYYQENLHTDISSFSDLDQNSVWLPSLDINAEYDDNCLTLLINDTEYKIYPDEHIIRSNGSETDYTDSLQNGIKYDILKVKRVFG